MTSQGHLSQQLEAAVFELADTEELRLNKMLLIFATGLICFSMMMWVAIYSSFGIKVSINYTLGAMLILCGNMFLYFAIKRFDFFRISQLGLFLFLPFVAQWAAGNLIVSSGVVLWALLAPIGAIFCIGARASLGWFIAWGLLVGISGWADWYLADTGSQLKLPLPTQVVLLFFTLNFISVAAISYSLLLFYIQLRLKAFEKLEKARRQLDSVNKAAEGLIEGPVIFM